MTDTPVRFPPVPYYQVEVMPRAALTWVKNEYLYTSRSEAVREMKKWSEEGSPDTSYRVVRVDEEDTVCTLISGASYRITKVTRELTGDKIGDRGNGIMGKRIKLQESIRWERAEVLIA